MVYFKSRMSYGINVASKFRIDLSWEERKLNPMTIVLLYVVFISGPAFVAGWIGVKNPASDFSLTKIADLDALVAIAIVSMQFILSARIHWIERPFGLDRVMLFHRTMAIFALTLLLMHPLLIAWDQGGEDGWRFLYTFSFAGEGWKIIIGKITLIILLTTAILSLFRLSLKVEYQLWLRLHNIFALCVITGGFIHGVVIGPDVQESPLMKMLWIFYPVLALSAYSYSKFFRAAWLKGQAYRVTNVSQETDSVWTLTLAPSDKRPVYKYLPGQFHFLTLMRAKELHPEQHPFTISSSPAEPGTIASSIKASGDYTAAIGKTAVNDRAVLLGPFGRFSYLLKPSERNFVFIAGGIGITPFISMIRHMRDTNDDREILLFYGNRKEKDIAFRKELEAIALQGVPKLRIVNVLSQADDDWTGERGYITPELIRKECKSLTGRVFYLCGPSVMMTGLETNLKKAGVKRENIRFEKFSI
jgi:predicted ferric reductase